MKITKEEFIKKYIGRSKFDSEIQFDKYFVVLKCKCKESFCQGWAVVCNNPLSIKAHKDLYQ